MGGGIENGGEEWWIGGRAGGREGARWGPDGSSQAPTLGGLTVQEEPSHISFYASYLLLFHLSPLEKVLGTGTCLSPHISCYASMSSYSSYGQADSHRGVRGGGMSDEGPPALKHADQRYMVKHACGGGFRDGALHVHSI